MRFGLSEEQNLTQPTISFGHGFLDDCNDITGWTKTEAGLAATLAVENGDYFKISGTCDSAANEYAYYEKDITDISTTLYPVLLVRWKTSEAANGLQARITAWYNDATFTDTVLGFSTIWKTTIIDLAAVKTLDKIRIYADDNPNTIAAGTFYVYFDFILVCQGIFTWPFVSDGINLDGWNNNQYLKILSKVGNQTQWISADDSTLQVAGDIDTTGVDAAGVPVVGEGWHGRWTTHDAEAFYQILHYGFGDPWQWFTSDVASLKVTLDHLKIRQSKSNENLLSYILDMHEYRLGSGSAETHLERFGIT
jgi:hypothetical protein